jgi:putative FmdB family regulatory protein
MPYYEYVCSSCEHKFELFQKIKDSDNESLCPKCSSSSCKKVISGGTGFILKGEGFYVNDYGKRSEFKDKENKE